MADGLVVADIMQPALTSVERNDHVAAAAYLMKRAPATALVVLDDGNRPIGLITEADIAHLVADGRNANDVRIYDLMTSELTVIPVGASIRETAETMMSGKFRHLPVVEESGQLAGMVDITDVCRALLDLTPA